MSKEAKKYFIPANEELAPKLSCGNAMVYAQVARSTQLAKKYLSTPLSVVKTMNSPLATL